MVKVFVLCLAFELVFRVLNRVKYVELCLSGMV